MFYNYHEFKIYSKQCIFMRSSSLYSSIAYLFFTAYVDSLCKPLADACFVDLCLRLSSAVIKHNIQLVPYILILQKKCSKEMFMK